MLSRQFFKTLQHPAVPQGQRLQGGANNLPLGLGNPLPALVGIGPDPLGHIAGVGAAVVGALSTFLSVPLGIVIGQVYNDTVLPLVGGFGVLSIASMIVMRWTERISESTNQRMGEWV